ncbi:IS66 family transposase [Planktothricoides raciborskii]|uniref:IS66 family transposase n=1 Tax=Planktothricoides raciborskii TaxID=132608 RepID=UPI002412CB90|nr:transposase [Planktothricoides raciborskii]
MQPIPEAESNWKPNSGKHFDGVLVSDDFKVYNGYPVAAQQKCLAHLRRHIQKLIKFGSPVQVTIGETNIPW